MNKMTNEEAREQLIALQNAREIFVKTGLTNNITLALEAYQRVFAKHEIRQRLSTKSDGNAPRTVMDSYERPLCPACGSEMKFRFVKDNPEGIKTQLICKNSECNVVLSDTHDLEWWMKNLRKKSEGENVV